VRRLFVVAEMTARELARRRGVLVLLLLLPLGFYALRHEGHIGQSIRSLFLGISWSVSTAALFATSANRAIEPRLRSAGYRTHELWLGRMLALWVLGVALAVPFFLLVAFDAPEVRPAGVALAMLACVAVGAPFGMLIGLLMPRELEGTLLLFTCVGLQLTIDPDASLAWLTPLWSSRELGTWAVDLTGPEHLERGVLHGLVATGLLVLAVAGTAAFRLRRRGHLVQLAGG
jgi:hypothetical protein